MVDVVISFPMQKGAEYKTRRHNNNMSKFLSDMLGLRVVKGSKGKMEEFVDESHRILRSDRCFLNEDGESNATLKRLDDDLAATDEPAQIDTINAQKLEEMKKILQKEYIAFTGSNEPCPQQKFCELVLRTVVKRLQTACGLTTRMKLGVNEDEVMVGVTADYKDLQTEADRGDYLVQMHNHPFVDESNGESYDKYVSHASAPNFNTFYKKENPEAYQQALDICRDHCEDCDAPCLDPGLWRLKWQEKLRTFLRSKKHKEKLNRYDDPRNCIFIGPYYGYRKEPEWQPFFRHYILPNGEMSAFRQVDRIRLVNKLIGRHINVRSLKANRMMKDQYAPHDDEILDSLRRTWVYDPRVNCFMKPTPILAIRDYFGEKISLYFAWLDFYTYQLLGPAVLGILAFVVSSNGGNKAAMQIIFGSYMSLWATFQSELWKRQNAFLNLWWGTFNAQNTDSERPTFIGTLRYNPITDQKEMYHKSKNALYGKITTSVLLVSFLVLTFVVATAFCFWLKAYTIKHEIENGPVLAGIANAGVISCGNEVALVLAKFLADRENHRTQIEYETQYNLYTFLFRFSVSYASFIYIAFLKTMLGHGPCLNDDCMGELSTQLASIFITGFIVQNGYEATKPLIMSKVRAFTGGVNAAQTKLMEQIEKESKFEPYEEKESMKDYAELVVQYGFVTLFVNAFTLVPALALVNNIVEAHVDGYKLCHSTKRPSPYTAANIGVWAEFMAIQSTVSVMTNFGLICFTSDIFSEYSWLQRWILFISCEHALFVLKVIVQYGVPDEPQYVSQLAGRHDFIANRLFNGYSDTNYDEHQEEAEKVDLVIYPNSELVDPTRAPIGAQSKFSKKYNVTEPKPKMVV